MVPGSESLISNETDDNKEMSLEIVDEKGCKVVISVEKQSLSFTRTKNDSALT